MNILVINAGSSSLKYQLMDMSTESLIAKGLVERIGIPDSQLTHQPAGMDKTQIKKDLKDHVEAIQLVMEALLDGNHGVLKDMSSINAVGHRVVHGGESFSGSVLIDADVLKAVRENCVFAPLHNPANLMGIEACTRVMPGVPQVAVFDTAFHASMPREAYLYGLPYEDYKELHIRRYGFHGTSHFFVAQRAAELINKPFDKAKIITCHLGNGSSIAAVKNGKSIDTSMGFTPLEGVIMGTRCGSIDTAILPFLMEKRNLTVEEAINYLNKKSGMLGLSGVSSDFRDIANAADAHNDRAQTALETFSYGVKKYIGAYTAAMDGVDCIVFTAGVGENDHVVRKLVLSGLSYLGITLDEEKNKLRGQEMEITAPGSKTRVFIIPTNEELVIARDTLRIVNG